MRFPEEEFIKALAFAQENVQVLVNAQKELIAACGKEKRVVELKVAEQRTARHRLPGGW